MSGRVRWQRDGETVTGFRKTDRRQSRRDPIDKLRAVNMRHADLPVRMAFRVPQTLEAFLSPGPHGIGVNVLARGYVSIASHSSEQCFLSAQEFFAKIAKDRPGFVVRASIINADDPGRSHGRWLCVVAGKMVQAAGDMMPKIYEAA